MLTCGGKHFPQVEHRITLQTTPPEHPVFECHTVHSGRVQSACRKCALNGLNCEIRNRVLNR